MTSSVGSATSSVASNLASSLTSSAGNLNSTLTGSDSSTSDAGSAIDQLANISQQLAQIQQQADASEVQEFEKDTRDVQYDNNATARDAGRLTQDKTRLNVISSLSQGDSVDVFKFSVTTSAATKIGTLSPNGDDSSIHYQVFSKSSGRLVADSDSGAGDAYKAYQQLQNGTLQLDKGDYVLRISRAKGVDTTNSKELQYAVQLTQGTYTQDYDLVEKAYRQGTDDPFGLSSTGSTALSNLIDGLSTSYSFINSLPAIGTDPTTKLTGALYDALF
ncbi:MAG TPA: hypothetical protein VHA35_20895 [Dongiaceae bacterium]|nr:hypothetical protein [Dongiaceae bacterium]